MRGREFAEMMAAAMDRLINARESIVDLDWAIETSIRGIKPEMLMTVISKTRQLTSFARVVMCRVSTRRDSSCKRITASGRS